MSEISEQARAAAVIIVKYVDRKLDLGMPTEDDEVAAIIQRAISASRPKWSSEKPTKPGWYWYKSGRSGDITIGEVDDNFDFHAFGFFWSVAYLRTGQFAGPLDPPAHP